MKIKSFFWICVLLVSFSTLSFSQYIEDALRYMQPNSGTGARALGLGNAYTGVADDFTAVWWNPAGLGQIKKFELTGGFSHFNYSDDATFLGNTSNYSNSATTLNNLGIVFPFPTVRGSLVFAVGYNRTNNFTTGMSFNGFNPVSSIIPTLITNDPASNIPYQTFLTDNDGLYTPLTKNLNQSGDVLEGGSLGNWAFSGAMEVAPNLYAGLSLHVATGSYSYDRNYNEADSKNYYTFLDTVHYSSIDFSRLKLEDNITSDFSGFGAQLGILYNFKNQLRFGLTIKTPFRYNVKEDFSTRGTTTFDNGDSYTYKTSGSGEYDVVTPYVFSGGVAWTFKGLMLSGDLEWIDYTQMEFDNANEDVTALNRDIKSVLQSVVNFRGGLEYTIPTVELKLRGGYGIYPSPFKGDQSEYNQKIMSFGLGYLVEESLMIDAAYSINSFTTRRVNYDVTSETLEKVKAGNLLVTLSFRF